MSANSLKFLQVNIGRDRAATLQAVHLARDTDIILLQEPYTHRGVVPLWSPHRVYFNNSARNPPKAAIISTNPNIQPLRITSISNPNIVAAIVTTEEAPVIVVSAYLHKQADISLDLAVLANIISRHPSLPVIIGMDANAKSPMWSSPVSDNRGRIVEEFLASHNLIVANGPSGPTFCRFLEHGSAESWIDITISSTEAARNIHDWRVLSTISATDHNFIFWNYSSLRSNSPNAPSTPRFVTSSANWDTFDGILRQEVPRLAAQLGEVQSAESLDVVIADLSSTLQDACQNSMSYVTDLKRPLVPWWTSDLASARKGVTKIRRNS